MKRKSFLVSVLPAALALALAAAWVTPMRAQVLQVVVQPKYDPMPPQVMNYIAQPGNYFNVTLNNATTDVMNVFMTMEVEQIVGGELKVVTPYYRQPMEPIVLPPSTPKVLSSVELQKQFRQLTTEEVVLTGGELSDFYGTGIVGLLPEGTYTATIKVYRWDPGVKYPQLVSDPMSGKCTFNVCYSAQSPEILMPFYQAKVLTAAEQSQVASLQASIRSWQKNPALNRARINEANEKIKEITGEEDARWQAAVVPTASANFSWMAPLVNCGGSVRSFKYQLDIWPFSSSFVSPEQAVEAGMVAYSLKNITTPNCLLDQNVIRQIQQQAVNSKYFVARVTATSTAGKDNMAYCRIENEGHSQLQVFRFDSLLVSPVIPEPIPTPIPDEEEYEAEEEEKEVPVVAPVVVPTDDTKDFLIYAPKIITPSTSFRGVLEDKAKVELGWESPQVISAPKGKEESLNFTYNIKVYKQALGQSLNNIEKNKPIITVADLSATKYTVPWDSLENKVKVNDNLVYVVTANCTNETSVTVNDEDHRNMYRQSYADLSDHSGGMADCYADAANNIANRELAIFTEKDLRDMEVMVGEFPMTITNANLKREQKCYAGKGFVTWYPFGKDGLPFMINVEFDSIRINKEKLVYEGQVKSCREEDPTLNSYIPYDIFDDCDMPSFMNTGNMSALGGKVDEYLQSSGTTAEYYKYAQSGAKILDDIMNDHVTVNLPVSLKKPMGDNGVRIDSSPIDIQIMSAVFSPTTASVSVLGMLAMPESDYIESDVAIFGAPRICIQPESLAPNGVTIALLSDFTLHDPKTGFSFAMKAPTNFIDLDDGCSMTFSANGLDSLCFEADMTVPGLLKADAAGNVVPNEDPAITIRAFIKDWDNWLGTLAMDNFQVEEAAGFTFVVGGEGISYDHSITHNPKGFSLPQDVGSVKYDKAAAHVEGNVRNWQGLYINKLGIMLPSFFSELNDDKAKPIEISMNNFLWDDSGASFSAVLKGSQNSPIVAAKTKKGGGWGISLEDIDINVLSSQFGAASIVGGLTTPVLGGEWQYKCSFAMAAYKNRHGEGLDINFALTPREKPTFDMFLATLELGDDDKYTHLSVHNFDDVTDVEMQLAGKITIAGLEDATKKIPVDFSISGVEFTGMRLANFAPEKRAEQSEAAKKKFSYTFDPICEGKEHGDFWFDLGTWSLASPSKKLGPFEFTLDNFGVNNKTDNGEQLTGLNLVGSVGLLGETFVATAGVTVWAKLDIADIKNIDVEYKETTLDKLAISSEFGGCKVAGSLEHQDKAEAKGYAGTLEFTMPGGLFTMKAAGGFFDCKDDKGSFNSAYFVAEVGSSQGIPIGPVALNNISGGFFFHTSLSNMDDDSPLTWTKTPTRGVHGGMFGLGISSVGMDRGFNAKVRMTVVYDAEKNKLSTFRMTGKMHALCVAPNADDGLINADCSIVYQNLSSKEGGKYVQLNITVDASGDMDEMVEQFTGQKIEIPDISAGLEEFEDKSGKKSKDAQDRKPKATCGFHIALDFKVTMKPDDWEGGRFDPKWHLWLGQPGDGSYESEMKNRCSITFIDYQVGGKNDPIAVWGKLWANAYLCLGNELPNDGALPPIPREIDEFLNGSKADSSLPQSGVDNSAKAESARKGVVTQFGGNANGGVMFGAQAGGEFGVNAVVCYAEASLMAGFDIALIQLKPGTRCGDKLAGGKGGFYGNGQIYAMAKGDMGLMLNLWIFKGKISIIDVGLGALLRGGAPNPTWIYGKVKARCKLFGGLIKWNGSLTLEAGEVCYPDAGNPLDDVQIFGDMSPGMSDSDTGWTGKSDADVSPYSTLGFTTNMAIGTRLDLVDENIANRMAGRDGDPAEYRNNATRSYKFYLEPQAELFDYGTNKDNKNPTLTLASYATNNQEDYSISVKNGKLNAKSYYMVRMRGYAKEIRNGKETDPIFNDSTTNFKDTPRPWRDTICTYFHTAALPANLSRDVAFMTPSYAGNAKDYNSVARTYKNEFAQPTIHLTGSRGEGGDDDIFDTSKYDITARIEKYDHGMWVPVDAQAVVGSYNGYRVDSNGDIDYFTKVDDMGNVIEAQHDPFSDIYLPNGAAKSYEYPSHYTGLACERFYRYVDEMDRLLKSTKTLSSNTALTTKYQSLKWVPESYRSLLIALDYYESMLTTDKASVPAFNSVLTSLNSLESLARDTETKAKNKQRIAAIDDDILYVTCPVKRNYNSSLSDDCTTLLADAVQWVEKGLDIAGGTDFKARTTLTPTEAQTVFDKVTKSYTDAVSKFQSQVEDIYCTEQSNTLKKSISELLILKKQAADYADGVKVAKQARQDIWTDKMTFLALMADGRSLFGPDHTIQQYQSELKAYMAKDSLILDKAIKAYPDHDYTKTAQMDFQSMRDSLELYNTWALHMLNEQDAAEQETIARAAWEAVVKFLASSQYTSMTDANRYEILNTNLKKAQDAYDKAVSCTNVSTHTTAAKGYRDAIADSIASNSAMSAMSAQKYVAQAKTAVDNAAEQASLAVKYAKNPVETQRLANGRVRKITHNPSDNLEKCYDYVDQALNVKYDIKNAYAKYANMKTDYDAEGLQHLSEGMRQDVENAKTVKAAIVQCETYAQQAQQEYDKAVAEVSRLQNVWVVTLTKVGTNKVDVINAVQTLTGKSETAAKSLVNGTLPVVILSGQSKASAQSAVTLLTSKGATATLTEDKTEAIEATVRTKIDSPTKSDSSSRVVGDNVRSATQYRVVVSKWGTKHTVLDAYVKSKSSGLSTSRQRTAVSTIMSTVPYTFPELMSLSDAQTLVKALQAEGATATYTKASSLTSSIGNSKASDLFDVSNWMAQMTPRGTMPMPMESEPETTGEASPVKAKAATKTASSVPATPSVPAVPGLPAASVISRVAANMNASSAKTSAVKSASSAAPAKDPVPVPVIAPATPAPASVPADNRVYADGYTSANNILLNNMKVMGSTDVYYAHNVENANEYVHSNEFKYQPDAKSILNSKMTRVPVTYHKEKIDANHAYYYLTVDGVDLYQLLKEYHPAGYCNGTNYTQAKFSTSYSKWESATSYRIIIEQTDKAKYAAFLDSRRVEEEKKEQAKLDSDNAYLGQDGAPVETQGVIDLDAYMAQYYKEMEEEGLMETIDTVSRKDITKNQTTDMFVKEILTKSLPSSVNAETTFAAWAQNNMAETGKSKGADKNVVLGDKEGFRPISYSYYNTNYTPANLAAKSDATLLTATYFLYDPYVWLAYMGGYVFFNGNPIYDKTDFLSADINNPKSMELSYPVYESAYRKMTQYTPTYTNRGTYANFYYQNGIPYVQNINYTVGSNLIKNVNPCYSIPTYDQCLSGNIRKKLLSYSSSSKSYYYTNDNSYPWSWTPVEAIKQDLRSISSIMTTVREENTTFRAQNDEQRRGLIQGWVKDDSWTSVGNVKYASVQNYFISMVDWWHRHNSSSNLNKTFADYPETRRTDRDAFGYAGGYTFRASDFSSLSSNKDCRFRFDWYCNNLKSVTYEYYRVDRFNALGDIGNQYDVSSGHRGQNVFTITHNDPLKGFGAEVNPVVKYYDNTAKDK